MAKGKYKRKKKHAQQQAQRRTADTVLPEQQEMTTNKAETTTERTKKSANSKNPSQWERFKEWASRDKSFTDWCLALFTLALACAAIYQFIIMSNQLDDMRKDQRPW